MVKEIQGLRLSKREEFFEYILSNDWKYLATFSFSNKEARNSPLFCSLWNDFCQVLKKNNKDFKSVAIIEKTSKGEYFLTALMANVDLSLKPAMISHTGEFLYSGLDGVQIFNCENWKEGYSTVSVLDSKFANEHIVKALSRRHSQTTDFVYIQNGLKEKTERRKVWQFYFRRRENEIEASILEIEEDLIVDYVPDQLSVSRYDDMVMVSRYFDTEKEARKFYDEFTASAYAFDLDKLKDLK